MHSKVVGDKIYPLLYQEEMKEKILTGKLEREDFDNANVFQFLSLLQADLEFLNLSYKPITIEEWKKVVKVSKKKSTYSIFSKRTYAVYKIALASPRLTYLLVRILNLTIKYNHVLNRWVKILDTVLEKEKGPVIRKLRIIQLIEGDLQLLMRALVTNRNSIIAENSPRLSQYNFGNRKCFDITTAILEKQLLKEVINLQNVPCIHFVDDRRACYDRQLPAIGLLAEQSFGMDKREANLLCHVLQNFEHHLSTAFGVSSQSYGGKSDILGGTGQGNVLSGAICKNISCLIFKVLEDQYPGIKIASPVTCNKIYRTVIAFVDDADFFIGGPDCVARALKILEKYNSLNAATAGQGQFDKNLFHFWQTEFDPNGNVKFKDLSTQLKVENTTIKHESFSTPVKSLGIISSPNMDWTEQFKVMCCKMEESIKKMMHTSLQVHEVRTFFHTYLIKKVFFGCGIFNLSEKQERILESIYETPILRKMGLSIKFPRTLMYVSTEKMGLGLLRPKTIMNQLQTKMLVGHCRIRSETYNLVQILHETIQFQYGLSTNIAHIRSTQVYWQRSWLDSAYHALRTRGISLRHSTWSFSMISKNETLMDVAGRFSTDHNHLRQINQCRNFKKLIYPFELLTTSGTRPTTAYLTRNAVSPFDWLKFQDTSPPSSSSWRIWEKFLRWLRAQQIKTTNDFKSKWTARWLYNNKTDIIIKRDDKSTFKVFRRVSASR